MFGSVGRGISDAGELAFKRQSYVSLIGQMLVMKAHIESLRSQNVFGMSVDRRANYTTMILFCQVMLWCLWVVGNSFWMFNEVCKYT